MPGAIALVDYGAGNLMSVRKGLAAAGGDVFTPAAPANIEEAVGIVVPGVGHFAATAALDELWRAALRDAIGREVPLLGICLGLQWLFEASEEAPNLPGFAAISGRCSRLQDGQKVPHVGWNVLRIRRPSRLLAGVADGSYAYFAHSYAAPPTEECVAVTGYGGAFASVVERNNVFGVQFHPEKSGHMGIHILANFVRIAASRPC
jgi:imidazole glycerol-phosphate synthase subunit HisH